MPYVFRRRLFYPTVRSMNFRSVSAWRAVFRIALLVAGVLSGVSSHFVSAASQQIATPANVNRNDTFLVGNEHFEASDNWDAVFCKTEDPGRCIATMIALTESKSAQEGLPNGQLVPMLTYISRPGERLFMLIKGLRVRNGEMFNVLAKDQFIAQQLQPIPKEPVSLVLGTETYEFRLDGLNLLIEERGTKSAKQSVPLFIESDSACRGSLRRSVRLEWMGDLDLDGRADFLVDASAYRSCELLPIYPEHFLILSSRGAKDEVGMVVPAVGSQQK